MTNKQGTAVPLFGIVILAPLTGRSGRCPSFLILGTRRVRPGMAFVVAFPTPERKSAQPAAARAASLVASTHG